MSLDKAIQHGKEKRAPYQKSKRFDPTCRNHGSCCWCENNRMHPYNRDRDDAEEEIEEFLEEE